MRKALIATSALAFAGAMAAVPASAADMMSVGVGGYMQQWIGYADRSDKSKDGGMDQQADSEIHFKGSLESDAGLKFTVHVELEGNNDGNGDTEIDESFVRISGSFGQLEMGQRDPISVRTHVSIKDVGIGLHAGDTQKWIPGAYLETAGHAHSQGDDLRINYISPRVNGIQVGLAYGADADNENRPTDAPVEGNDNSWAVGLNYTTAIDDSSFSFSAGHYQREQNADSACGTFMKDNEDYTYTNLGVGVGFGAFAFNVSWATRDNGAFTGADAATCVNDKAGEWDTVGASVTYTDGPMSLSLGHMTHETEAEKERSSTMFSASYSLAPGVAWKTSIFAVEDDTTTDDANMTVMNEGSAFVTGIALSF